MITFADLLSFTEQTKSKPNKIQTQKALRIIPQSFFAPSFKRMKTRCEPFVFIRYRDTSEPLNAVRA